MKKELQKARDKRYKAWKEYVNAKVKQENAIIEVEKARNKYNKLWTEYNKLKGV